MKKLFLLATTAMLMTGVAFANGGPKEVKKNSKKAQTEKTCPKGCCEKNNCCDKNGHCTKS